MLVTLFHPYPAMLHPLLVEHLLNKYGNSRDVHVFDPFCGSGVKLTTAANSGYVSTGFDINPLALSLARVKTTYYVKEKLESEFKDFVSELNSSTSCDVPTVKNLDYWYSTDCIEQLGRIRAVLLDSNYLYQIFFTVNFAFVCRHQSLTRNGEFKRYRLPLGKVKTFECKAIANYSSRTMRFVDLFAQIRQPKAKSYQYLANSEQSINSDIKYDLFITSPPYGDSRTTVAYGQYSSFGLE